MKRLNREQVEEPASLNSYQHGRNDWNDVTAGDKAAIWLQLYAMQGNSCAYCEASLTTFGKHIEHFRTRNGHPTLTFEWANLFGSCSCDDSCGTFKDQRGRPYAPDDLLDPTVDDPDHFFEFRTDGSIAVKASLDDHDQHRARETLRVFNLDPSFGRWRQMRRTAVECYQAAELDITAALMEFDEDERLEYVRDEIAKVSTQPFSAPIRQLFSGLY